MRSRLGKLLGGLAAIVLFAMMALTVVDVAGRYLFARPVPGAFELTQILLALLIFTGLPLVSARNGHVTISLADRWFGARAGKIRDRAVALLCALVAGVIAWRLWVLAGRLGDYGDIFEFIGLPKAPLAYAMSGLAAATAVVLIARIIAPRAFRD